jgi:hypothetical protein
MARTKWKIIFYLLLTFVLINYVQAQTATYHQHKEASSTATRLQGKLTTSRQRQRATLLPDGSVLIEGGVDEAFEPQSKNFNGSP